MQLALLATCLLPTVDLSAQEPTWKLPERGAAVYQRTVQVDASVEARDAPASLPWSLPPNAGVVLAGELDPARLRPTDMLTDPRDLLAALLLDLGRTRAGRVTLDVPGNGRFRPCRLEAEFGATAEDGTQKVTASIVAAPEPKPAPGASASRPPRLEGTLHGSRRIDREAGRVVELEGEIALETDGPADASARRLKLRITDRWRFERLLTREDPEFRVMVGKGIDLARGALRGHLARQHGAPPVQRFHDVPHGELALTLLALVKGGEDPTTEPVASAYADLRRRELTGTYALSVAILAIEALYTPATEWTDLRAGRLEAPHRRRLSESDMALVRGWTQALLGNIDSKVAAGDMRRWHYGPSPLWDNSNTQYALLGLYAAQLCGVEIGPEVWTAAANHLLRSAMVTGPGGRVRALTHAGRDVGGRARPLGWSYHTGWDVTGSMTCGGLGGLILCASGLRAQKAGAPRLLREVDDGVRGGLLWVQDNLSVRRNPGAGTDPDDWTYYHLYALERACEMSHVALVGGRDWYFEGALQILGQQEEGGGFGKLADTCFALLFLKNSVLPTAATGPR